VTSNINNELKASAPHLNNLSWWFLWCNPSRLIFLQLLFLCWWITYSSYSKVRSATFIATTIYVSTSGVVYCLHAVSFNTSWTQGWCAIFDGKPGKATYSMFFWSSFDSWQLKIYYIPWPAKKLLRYMNSFKPQT